MQIKNHFNYLSSNNGLHLMFFTLQDTCNQKFANDMNSERDKTQSPVNEVHKME